MKKLLYTVLFTITLVFTIDAQNLVVNPNFQESNTEITNWTHTPWNGANGVELRNDGTNNFVFMNGENGYLYQKITNFTKGLPYVFSVNFKDVSPKQTTGIGFAIEKGNTHTIPTLTKGSTDLNSFATNNNGLWWQFLSSDPSSGEIEYGADGNTTYKLNITMPVNATGIYLFTATKGAIASLQVNEVVFEQDANTQKVTFNVTDSANNPLENATIEIDGFSFDLNTDVSGNATTNLLLGTSYKYFVLKENYQMFEGNVTVDADTNSINIQLQDFIEIKDVQTRISEYGDNATPYPIYAHFWNQNLNYTPEINQKIVNNFDYIIGGGDISNNTGANLDINALKALDNQFQVITYQGGWSSKVGNLNDKKFELLFYLAGTLRTGIDATTTSIVINRPSTNKGLGLVASEDGNFETWLRVEDELMKITTVSSTTSYPVTVTVERGYDGTTPVAHSSNTVITAPVYTEAPVVGGNNANLSYFNPVFGARKDELKNNAIELARFKNQDGIWIDILVGLLGAKNMSGGNYTLWSYESNKALNNQEINLRTKDALDEMYDGFYALLGYYPVIYGNNVLYNQNYNTSARGFVMEKTAQHPKGLDGFCHENSWGHMSDDSSGIDNDGEPVNTADIYRVVSKYNNGRFLEWYMGNTWINRCKAIALLAQRELPNQPMTINAGFKNIWFAYDLTNEQRYDFHKYSYASYLMSVHVDANNKIASRMGISPMTEEANGNVDLVVEPFFFYDIGVPTETYNHNGFTQYRVGSNNLYARKFSKGLVLINPFSNDMSQSVTISSITGDGEVYLNPEDGDNQVTSVQLKSRETMLLLKDNTASIDDFENQISMYPNPVKDILNLNLKNSKLNLEKVSIEIYNIQGMRVHFQESDLRNDKSIEIKTQKLSTGVYFVKFPQINVSVKFIKI